MTGIRLTTRGKIVIGIIVTLIALALLSATTPNECNVDVSEMSTACKSLLFS